MSDFDEFWRLYPKKVDKLDAMKAWKQMTCGNGKFTAEEIIAGLKRNLPMLLAKDIQYVKYPAGWLRKGAWMDEPSCQASAPTGKRTIIEAAMDRLQRAETAH